MPTSVLVEGADALAAYLDRVTSEFMPAMDRATAAVADAANVAARENINAKQGPRPYGPQPGTLMNSILTVGPRLTEGSVTYVVGSSVIYSRIQELGGTVTAKNGPYLTFRNYYTGAWVKVHSVTIPAKHYMEKGAAEAAGLADGIFAATLTEVFG